MEPPTTGAHLQEFIFAMQWMKTSIPDFSNLIAPLHDFIESVYEHVRKRTKIAVASIKLQRMGWQNPESDAFETWKTALANLVTLADRHEKQRLSIFTDASDTVWSRIVTQVPFPDLTKPYIE